MLRILSRVRRADAQPGAVDDPPRIVLIGQTYVGKTSTVNALFQTNLPVGHGKPTTDKPTIINAEGPLGQIVVVDMPGLAASIEEDKRHLPYYREELPKADVALWVMDSNPALRFIQEFLSELKGILDKNVFDRIVFCVNKADTFAAGQWYERVQAPDAKMQKSIDTYVKRLQDILNISRDRIVVYSALKGYELPALLDAMLEAVPPSRKSALKEHALLTDRINLMNPAVQEEARARAGRARVDRYGR